MANEFVARWEPVARAAMALGRDGHDEFDARWELVARAVMFRSAICEVGTR